MKEKLIITCEIEDFPENMDFLEFRLMVVEDGFFTRVFRNWKRVTYRRAVVTNMQVEKGAKVK